MCPTSFAHPQQRATRQSNFHPRKTNRLPWTRTLFNQVGHQKLHKVIRSVRKHREADEGHRECSGGEAWVGDGTWESIGNGSSVVWVCCLQLSGKSSWEGVLRRVNWHSPSPVPPGELSHHQNGPNLTANLPPSETVHRHHRREGQKKTGLSGLGAPKQLSTHSAQNQKRHQTAKDPTHCFRRQVQLLLPNSQLKIPQRTPLPVL